MRQQTGLVRIGLLGFITAAPQLACRAPSTGTTSQPHEQISMVASPLENSGSLGARLPGLSLPMVYGNGPLMTQGANLYLIWYGNWDADPAVPVLESFAASVGGSSYLDIVTTYKDSTGAPAWNYVSVNGEVSINSTSSYGTNLTTASLPLIVNDLINSGLLPRDSNGVYVLLTATDVTLQGFGTQFCGYHSRTSDASPLKFVFVGNARNVPLCLFTPAYAPNGDVAADTMVSVFAHELAETMTDPIAGTGWADSDPTWHWEIADKCGGTKLGQYETSPGVFANLHLGSRDYLVQSLWLNGTNGMCAMSRSAATLACTNGVLDGVETDVDCGGVACPPCMSGQHCATQDDCAAQQGVCYGGVCRHACIPNGAKDGTETDVDCGDVCTTRCAVGQTCAVDSDCASSICNGNVCTAPGTCTDGSKNARESDVDCGGDTCAACGVGKTCLQDSDCGTETCRGGTCRCTGPQDCASGQSCVLGACKWPATCTDGTRNGSETDVDCGGGTCGACGVGKICTQDTDCTTETCRSGTCRCTGSADCPSGQSCSLGVCRAAATCTDGSKNGNETDVDCGGGTCGACGVGKICVQDTDCTTETCRGGTCRCTGSADCAAGQFCSLGICRTPTCTDGIKNGSETDVDCGGSCSPCVPGKSCATGYDCTTEICASNTCRCTSPVDCPAGNTRCLLGICYP
jgi:hypothetical protein